jgi:hypothetical protein
MILHIKVVYNCFCYFCKICRPYFTYWVTFVQIVCFIVSVSIYGIATPGGAVTTVSGEVCVEIARFIRKLTVIRDGYFKLLNNVYFSKDEIETVLNRLRMY